MGTQGTSMERTKVEFLRCYFDQIEGQVQFGDSKASLLIASDAILLAVSGGLIKLVSGCNGTDFSVACMVPSVALGLAIAASALLILSLACSLVAIRPAGIHDQPRPELFLISHIARIERPEFLKSYRDASWSDMEDEALGTIHGKASYATAKFGWLKCAINSTLLSLAAMTGSVLFAAAERVLGDIG